MFDTSFWLIFLSAALALNLSPGPDLIYILSRTMAQGRKIGIASATGVCTGALLHVFAAALGLSAVLATSAVAFTAVKYAGAIYLVYQGIQALRSSGGSLDFSRARVSAVGAWQAFRQGVLVDILNPKVAIFFMAFLPQFVRIELGRPALQIAGLGVLVVLVALLVEVVFVLAVARATGFFGGRRKVSARLERMLGGVLIGLGLRLAVLEQHP